MEHWKWLYQLQTALLLPVVCFTEQWTKNLFILLPFALDPHTHTVDYSVTIGGDNVAGVTTCVDIEAIDDNVFESDTEQFTITLSASDPYIDLDRARSTATVSIRDTDGRYNMHCLPSAARHCFSLFHFRIEYRIPRDCIYIHWRQWDCDCVCRGAEWWTITE